MINVLTSKATARWTTEITFRHNCVVFEKNAYTSEKQVPPAGVQGQKPRCFFIGRERSAKVKQYVFT